MKTVIVNNSHEIVGKFSVYREKVDDKIVVIGALQTPSYIEELHSLKSDKYFIDGIDVHKESFGSEDDQIIYEFTAEELDVHHSIELKAGE